jgi:hypothetical protein
MQRGGMARVAMDEAGRGNLLDGAPAYPQRRSPAMMPDPNPPMPNGLPPRPGPAPLREQVEALMNRCVTPTLGEAAGQAEAALQDAGAELRAQAARLAGTVRAQPLTAIGLAALAGFMAARLSRR